MNIIIVSLVALVAVCKRENIPLCEVSVSRQRPRKEERLQVTLESGYSSRMSDKRWKRVPDTCPQQQERHGRRLSFYGLAEPPAKTGMLNAAAWGKQVRGM